VTPVKTDSSNMVYVGPTPDIGDLHCERLRSGVVRSVWWLTPEERAMVAEGANLSLTIWGEPIPSVSLDVTNEQGVGEDAPDIRERLHELVSEGAP